MTPKQWNKMTPRKRLSVLFINNMAYYPYYNSLTSWKLLTAYVQNLLSKIEVKT